MIELIRHRRYSYDNILGIDCGTIADHLLANGVVVLPCKVGDTVYRISQKFCTKTKYVQKTKISRITIDDDGIWLFCECNPTAKCIFGKTVFLTREEAEAALERMNNSNG